MTDPAFVTVAFLYAKTSRAGNPLLFGEWGDVRLYVFPTEDRKPKDCKPEYRVCIRHDDYLRIKASPPPAVRKDSDA